MNVVLIINLIFWVCFVVMVLVVFIGWYFMRSWVLFVIVYNLGLFCSFGGVNLL